LESLEKKIEMLRKTSQEKDKLIVALESRLNDLEISVAEKYVPKPNATFDCEKYSFSTSSESGLKTHVRKKHSDQKESIENNFPQQCTLCDLIFNDKNQMKKHMRTHSYSNVQYNVIFVT
jgi:uncharacterized Zn-finger protein